MWLIVGCLSAPVDADEPVLAPTDTALFDKQIAPLLQQSCIECHNANKREGGLALDSADGVAAGGDSGNVVVVGHSDASPLVDAVTTEKGDAKPPVMPKGRPALKDAEVALLRDWIDQGARWPQGLVLEPRSLADQPWWSLSPLVRTVSPANVQSAADETATLGNVSLSGLGEMQPPTSGWIDAWVRDAQLQNNVEPNGIASRRDLLRRASYDLTGLPPTRDEVDAFVADRRPDAYERRVDRLLASPAMGERWARHWLDAVHYGESHGYDKDKLRTHAWPYRDYVIRSFNSDKPYGQFVAEQIAGDVLAPEKGDAIEALGFLSAGPWDFIGHAEVPESKLDGKRARHLDRDDMLQNTFLTFQSLTVGCAQCHDHKFDPISQREYYGLQAVFAALDRADRQYFPDPKLQSQWVALQTGQRELLQRSEVARKEIQRAGGEELAMIDVQIAAEVAATKAHGPDYPIEHGYHSAITADAHETKWVQVDLGQSVEISSVQWIACHDDFAGIGDGFGAPPRWRIEISDSADFSSDRRLVFDQTQTEHPNPGIALQLARFEAQSARYVRFTATELAVRQNDFILALSELRVLDAAGSNVAAGKTITALDTIEAPPRWSLANLVDGKFPLRPSSDAFDKLTARRDEVIARQVPVQLREHLLTIDRALAETQAALTALPEPQKVYVATIYEGSGTFVGTGASGGQPRPVYFLPRGDVSRPADQVAPTALACLSVLDPNLGAIDSTDGQRRNALASWITDDANPLTWRSIANRLWAAHFRRGLVDTPNDFGRMGGEPTHAGLLDQLAIDVRDHQSLKRLHRQIMLSQTYCESSHSRPEMLERDPDNRWLGRSPRRRLEAEAIRDTMLLVAGRLRREMGGPSFQDFVIEHPEHSPHYEYALHDPRDPATQRRSIYRFLARSQTQPLMTALDCADPSMQVDVRGESNSATQALSLLNNAFTLMAAEEWSDSLRRPIPLTDTATHLTDTATHLTDTATHLTDKAMPQTPRTALAGESLALVGDVIRTMFSDALQREPTARELETLSDLAGRHGIVAVARVIFNLNEFFYVD